jgi:Bacterial TniB protein
MTKPVVKLPVDPGDDGLLDPFVAYMDEEDARVEKVIAPLRERYVVSARDDRVKKHLKRLIKNFLTPKNSKLPLSPGNRKPGVGFAVIAPSGAGKTTTIDHILRNHPAFPGYGVEGAYCTVLFVQAPGPCTLGQLANEALKALGYNLEKPLPETKALARARYQIEKQKIRILYIGDINHVLHQANRVEIVKIADTFKNVMINKRWPVQLMMDGTLEMLNFPKGDRQFTRRLKFLRFDDISEATDGKLVADSIKDYARDAGLKLVVEPGDMLTGRLCRAAAFQMGLVFEILVEAIEVAVTARRKTLKISDFAEAYADRVVQPVDLNMFLSPTWQTLDPSVIWKDPREPEEAEPKKRSKGRTKF